MAHVGINLDGAATHSVVELGDKLLEVATMTDTNGENKENLSTTELKRYVARVEEMLLAKEKMVEVLQDSEKRYRRLFESARDGILILDAATGKVVDVNPFLLQLLGIRTTQFAGNISGSSVSLKILPRPRRFSRPCRITNSSGTRICLWKHAMGRPSPWSLSAMSTWWTMLR